MGIVSSKLKLEGSVVQIIKDWATDRPEELLMVERLVKEHRHRLAHGSAVSIDGNMLLKAEIPASLYWRIGAIYGKDWIEDHMLRNMFFRNFTVGLVNRTSESKK